MMQMAKCCAETGAETGDCAATSVTAYTQIERSLTAIAFDAF